MPQTPYDVVTYHSFPYYETHPDRQRLAAHLFGLEAAPVDTARILEIGCGSGGNLLPIAELHPGATCVGVDLAGSQIEAGRADAAALGLRNVEMRHLDLVDLRAADGPFDYIIAHGVYSWIPAPARARLLDLTAELLAPRGVALISHNVKPGWYPRAMARDLMRWHAAGFGDPGERVAQARSFLSFLLSVARPEEGRHKMMLQAEVEHVTAMPDWVVLHDYLADVNEGCYFHEFAAELPPRGLQFLADADVATMLPAGFPTAVRDAIGHLAPDLIAYEQVLDFIKNRAFRQTLMCRAGLPLERSLGGSKLKGLQLSVRATEDRSGIWRKPGDVAYEPSSEAGRQALRTIAAAWPGSLPADDLPAEAQDDVFLAFVTGIVQLGLTPARSGLGGDRPAVTPHVRLLAARGGYVTNLRHENTRLSPAALALAATLDGTRPRADLPEAPLQELAMKALLF